MDVLDNILHDIRYTKEQKNNIKFVNRIVTNEGVFFTEDTISNEIYNKITCVKVYGSIIEKIGFQSFVNLTVLDVSSMNWIKQINLPKPSFTTSIPETNPT
jgi:hypothetical protein